MEKKERIRRQVLALRDGMTKEERDRKSGAIMEKILCTRWYQEADILLVYVNFRSEADTGGLIERALLDGKKVYCPRVEGEIMNFYRIFSMDDLEKGYCGIREPLGKKENLFSPETGKNGKCLMIMPGSAFDRERNRIGYGKGYYDKYLDSYWNASPGNDGAEGMKLRTIGICFDCQMQKRVPAGYYDRKADMVITESEVICIS